MNESFELLIEAFAPDKAPMELLLDADPNESRVKKYMVDGHCFQASIDNQVVGACVICPIDSETLEIMNIAVTPDRQGEGIGSRLLRHAIGFAREQDAKRLELGTGTFGYQLAFYQKAGFRAYAVERDFFIDNYDAPIIESGIQHKDRLRLAIEL